MSLTAGVGAVAAGVLTLFMSVPGFAPSATTPGFTPARLSSGSTPPLPSPNTISSIEESLELSVDAAGRVRVIAAAQAPPGPSLVLTTVAGWQFEAATESGFAVGSRVLVAAVYRAPALYNAASSAPVSLVEHSSGIPFPALIVPPPYPPLAAADAVVIVEVLVGVDGRVTTARVVGPAPGFGSAALAAARDWSFQPAQRGTQPVPAYAYLVFGFRRPMATAR
jgi:TonB family protein